MRTFQDERTLLGGPEYGLKEIQAIEDGQERKSKIEITYDVLNF